MGILPEYHNIMIHDFWKAYFRIENATHGICCARLQRELVYADEQMNQSWAKPMHDLLSEILHHRQKLESLGDERLFPGRMKATPNWTKTNLSPGVSAGGLP